MAFNEFLQSVRNIFRPKASGSRVSRRDFLSGIGVVGALAVAGPVLLSPSEAEAQYSGRGRHGPPRHSRRRRRRGRRSRRDYRRGRRYSRRQLISRCRDPRFRYRNRSLCHRVTGMRPLRRGTCIQIGPVTICD